MSTNPLSVRRRVENRSWIATAVRVTLGSPGSTDGGIPSVPRGDSRPAMAATERRVDTPV
ncbi:hypothetical protein D8S78_13145 [Natrialba swarupiae]|nr:hypothetical protein [Natrialba swarupiae]